MASSPAKRELSSPAELAYIYWSQADVKIHEGEHERCFKQQRIQKLMPGMGFSFCSLWDQSKNKQKKFMIKSKIHGPTKILFSASGQDWIFTNNNLTYHILLFQEYIWSFPRKFWIFSVHEKIDKTSFFKEVSKENREVGGEE